MKSGPVALLLIVAACLVGSARAEVTVSRASSGRYSVAVLGGGSNGSDPWPEVRQNVSSSFMLNALGSTGQHPDGVPSIGIDPISHEPEVAWAHWDGNDYEVVLSRWLIGDRWSDYVYLTANDVDDIDPQLAYAPDGTARVSWWTAGQVQYAARPAGQSWSAPEYVDAGAWPSVGVTTDARVAYQRSDFGLRWILGARQNGSWSSVVIAATTFVGFDGQSNDVRLHAQDGRVWIDWEDSATSLGWSVLGAGGTWSVPATEPVCGPDGEEQGRMAIRGEVLGTP